MAPKHKQPGVPHPYGFQGNPVVNEHLPVQADPSPHVQEPASAAAARTYQPPKEPVEVFGLPILPVTFEETLDEVDRLIAAREPNYFITANLHYAMLSHRDPRIAAVNRDAAFLVADGFPLLLAAKLRGQPLPQRVTGSDLIYALCERAAAKGHRVFFLGGAPGVADAAASELTSRYPGLIVAGVEVPPFRTLDAEENARLCKRIADAGTDLLLVALGQPKGELWLWENREALQVPAAVQLGASFDFVAGRVKRAPRWIQRLNLEWAYRMFGEPKRLGPRYVQDALFLARSASVGLFTCCRRKKPQRPANEAATPSENNQP